jgi:prepilin-type N-terminal cleavage/methylation domain-containing protein
MNSVKRLAVKERKMKRHLKQFDKEEHSVQLDHRCGFTLVELLTVLAIIALLIGLLVPALNTTRRFAKDVRQGAQFHSIEAALETFQGDYGDYPSSNETTNTGVATCGSQKFTEALLGLDLRGYDPYSDFDLVKTEANYRTYALLGVGGATAQDVEDSLNRRRGPYLKTDENVGAYNLYNLFDVAAGGSVGDLYAGGDPLQKKFGPVLCDTYRVKNIQIPDPLNPTTDEITVKVGTPILYYRANKGSKLFDRTQVATSESNIYNWKDNGELVDLGLFTKLPASRTNADHHFGTGYSDTDHTNGMEVFYDRIINPKVIVPWPHNPDLYILISAGYDGIYGTDDDVANFGGE